MAGFLGQLARRSSAPTTAPAGLQVYGWNGDLVDLAEIFELFDVIGENNCTENQAKAALSIEGGALVIDTDAAVAAGAGVDCTFQLKLKQHTAPLYIATADVERLGGTSSLYVRSNPHYARLRTPEGDVFTPNGATTSTVGTQCFTNNGSRVHHIGGAAQTNSGSGFWRQIANVSPWSGSASGCDAESYACGDATFSSGSSYARAEDSRDPLDGAIPLDHYFEHSAYIASRINDGSGLVTGRIYMKYHRWQIISTPKAAQ